MIRRVFGALLALAGGILLYLFAASTMYHARGEMGAEYEAGLPFRALGANFPADVMLLLGGGWCLLLGLWFTLTGSDSGGPQGGRVSRAYLINALMLLSTLFAGVVGARTASPDSTTLAVFGLVAFAQAALGVILLIMALAEKPKGYLSLLCGSVLWLGGVGIAVLSFLWGAPA